MLSITEWANTWGKTVGVYGYQSKDFSPGHHDDLDAFRHAFCHAVLVSLINLNKPYLEIPYLSSINLDNIKIAERVSDIIGHAMESILFGHSAKPCPKAMDIYNNEIGKNLGLTQAEGKRILSQEGNIIVTAAHRVAKAVKSGKTINSLDDPRMPKDCQLPAKLPTAEYLWRTASDEKVRYDHAVREGRRFTLQNPPEGGPPGAAFNCRCHAEPVITREPIK
jgi:hypothetical protein